MAWAVVPSGNYNVHTYVAARTTFTAGNRSPHDGSGVGSPTLILRATSSVSSDAGVSGTASAESLAPGT